MHRLFDTRGVFLAVEQKKKLFFNSYQKLSLSGVPTLLHTIELQEKTYGKTMCSADGQTWRRYSWRSLTIKSSLNDPRILCITTPLSILFFYCCTLNIIFCAVYELVRTPILEWWWFLLFHCFFFPRRTNNNSTKNIIATHNLLHEMHIIVYTSHIPATWPECILRIAFK